MRSCELPDPRPRRLRLHLLCALYAAVLAAAFARADESNIVWLTLKDHSFNPITLTLDWHDARAWEGFPGSREFLRIARGEVSLEFWRFLLWGEVAFDAFTIDGFDLALVRHPDDSITPLSQPGVTNVFLRLAVGSGTNAFSRKDVSRKNAARLARTQGAVLDEQSSTPLILPELLITNLNVVCTDGATGPRLWSYDNAWFLVRNFRVPVLESAEDCTIQFGTRLNGLSASWFSVSTRLRTLAADPAFHLTVTAAHVRLDDQWLRAAGDRGAAAATNAAASGQRTWFDAFYSNAWWLLMDGMDAASADVAALPVVSNFIAGCGRSNIEFGVWADIAISNRMPMPGVVAVTLQRVGSTATPLRIRYTLSDTPPWVTYGVNHNDN